MIKKQTLFILTFLLTSTIFSQWQYATEANKSENIFVTDSKNESTFSIQKSKEGKVKFFIKLETEKECKINQIQFKFDGIKSIVKFEAQQTKNDLVEILYDQVNDLENLEIFSLFIKKRNILYVTFLDRCGFNQTKNYTLKGSSKAIDRISLIQHLSKTIRILKAKKEKLAFIANNLPRLDDKNLLEKKLIDVDLLDVEEVSWKSFQNDKYNIKIRLKINGSGFKELFGTFRLYKPVKSIKSRY